MSLFRRKMSCYAPEPDWVLLKKLAHANASSAAIYLEWLHLNKQGISAATVKAAQDVAAKVEAELKRRS